MFIIILYYSIIIVILIYTFYDSFRNVQCPEYYHTQCKLHSLDCMHCIMYHESLSHLVSTIFMLCTAITALLLAIALIVVSAAFGITMAVSQGSSQCSDCNKTNTTDDDVCTTPSCVKLAASILSNMNQSVDPCKDFYNFTCGGWDDDNIVPPGTYCSTVFFVDKGVLFKCLFIQITGSQCDAM